MYYEHFLVFFNVPSPTSDPTPTYGKGEIGVKLDELSSASVRLFPKEGLLPEREFPLRSRKWAKKQNKFVKCTDGMK